MQTLPQKQETGYEIPSGMCICETTYMVLYCPLWLHSKPPALCVRQVRTLTGDTVSVISLLSNLPFHLILSRSSRVLVSTLEGDSEHAALSRDHRLFTSGLLYCGETGVDHGQHTQNPSCL